MAYCITSLTTNLALFMFRICQACDTIFLNRVTIRHSLGIWAGTEHSLSFAVGVRLSSENGIGVSSAKFFPER